MSVFTPGKKMNIKTNTPTSKKDNFFQIINTSSFTNIIPIQVQGTSKMYNGWLNNDKYYIKEVVKYVGPKKRKTYYGVYDIELAINEVLASIIYNKVYKVDAIELFFVVNDSIANAQKYMVASKSLIIDSCEQMTHDCNDMISNKIKGVVEPFIVDCILANWDVGEIGNVGIIKTATGRKAFRIDVGGSLLYRALGQAREYRACPTEHETFFKPNYVSYKLFKNIRKKQIPQMFNIISKVDLYIFDMIYDVIKKALTKSISSQIDLKRALKVLKSLDVVKARHLFYISESPYVKEFILTKVTVHS